MCAYEWSTIRKTRNFKTGPKEKEVGVDFCKFSKGKWTSHQSHPLVLPFPRAPISYIITKKLNSDMKFRGDLRSFVAHHRIDKTMSTSHRSLNLSLLS